jgi:hypothetical protein
MNDILTAANGDIIFKDNDITIGFSDLQHQEDLLLMQKGELKREPLQGVGIENFLNESDIDGMLAEVKTVFTNDGMDVQRLSFDEQTGNLNYHADYKIG